MRRLYTIIFFFCGRWRNEGIVYSSRKAAEKRKSFILLNFMQEIEEGGKVRHRLYRKNEIEIVEVKEVKS